MNKNTKIIVLVIGILAICAIGVIYYSYDTGMINTSGNETITDMVGRTVEVPTNIEKVIATSPPMTTVVYMLAPEKLGGLNFNWTKNELKYVPKEYQNIPVIGGWFGRQDGNYEEMIAVGPDIIIEGAMGSSDLSTINTRQKNFGSIPVVGVNDSTKVTKIAPSIEFVGKLLGGDAETRATNLVAFTNKYLDKVNSTTKSIPDSEKKKVYYAEGTEGLQTDPNGSDHSQLINLCGGINVADIPVKEGVGQVDVSMEQVIKWNPEIIITTDPTFYKKVYNDSQWSNIDAVKNKKVYLSPQSPFKWFDRPPGANIIIGIPWTAKVIYPEKYKDINLKEATKEFYTEFYHYNLTDEEATNLLKSSGLKEENM